MFSINIEQYYKEQRDEFKEFSRDHKKLMLIAARNTNALDKFAAMTGGIRTEFKDGNSHIITYTNKLNSLGDPVIHLYIKGTFPNYRARFQDFLIQHYKFDNDFNLDKSDHADHLFNKARAKQCFIRMILLPGNINTGWGRSYERIVTNLEKKKEYKDMYLLDYVLLLKAVGFTFFKKKDISDNDTGISEAANKALEKYKSAFQGLGESYDSILLTYFRAEINYMVRKRFYDHEYVNKINKELNRFKGSDDSERLNDLRSSLLLKLKSGHEVILDDYSNKYPPMDESYKCIDIPSCESLYDFLNDHNKKFGNFTVRAFINQQTFKGVLRIKIECLNKLEDLEEVFWIEIERA